MFVKIIKFLKLKLFYNYLAGAIEFDKKDGGQSWRNSITPPLDKILMYTQDPCKTEALVTDMTVMEAQEKFNGWIQSGNYDLFTDKFAKIVHKDLRMVYRSDFLIVHLFPKVRTTGTIHEMAETWRQKKPIYLIWKDAKSNLSKWALYLVISSGGRLFESENKLIEFLSVKYAIENQSFRKQITQILKSFVRLIDEKIYTFRIIRQKRILAELLEKKKKLEKKIEPLTEPKESEKEKK